MKNKILSMVLLVFAVLQTQTVYSQMQAKDNQSQIKLAKELSGIVKANSLYADSLNWIKIDSALNALSYQANALNGDSLLGSYIIDELRNVGDKHSFLQSKVNVQRYATNNAVTEQPVGRLINGNIGYVKIPAFTSNSDTASLNFAQRIQNIIRDLDDSASIKGWIVDLRTNGGGNMYPMIAGAGPLTGDGTLGYFVTPKAKLSTNLAWLYKNGISGANRYKIVIIKQPYTIKNGKSKIAVLVGAGTASSGEMTAISFIGKQNTQLFGQPTAGYVTANRTLKLSTGANLLLAHSYVADRNQKSYLTNVIPDVYIAKDETGVDVELTRALYWLNN